MEWIMNKIILGLASNEVVARALIGLSRYYKYIGVFV
jgi:hypothetical protein